MVQEQITSFIAERVSKDGLTDTGIPGVQFFRATQSMPCIPAVYSPCVVAITSGTKEAVLDGQRYVYDASQYLCCPMSMPVKAGTPAASPDDPLFGVFVSLENGVLGEIANEMENAGALLVEHGPPAVAQAIKLAHWDNAFSDAMLRLVQLADSEADRAVLGHARLRELYYAILKGEAGLFAGQAFGVGRAIARSIAHVSAHLDEPISIDDMAQRARMSRAVFHRKFKSATTMSPIQFVKSMRLNTAAMQIAEGKAVNEAALGVGYISTSQFSREFKRMYGKPPRQWSVSA